MSKIIKCIIYIFIISTIVSIVILFYDQSNLRKYVNYLVDAFEYQLTEKEQKICGIGVNDRTIKFEGKISDKGCSDKFIELAEKNDVNLLLINSSGGDSKEGIKIGEWISKNNIDIEVVEKCMSSCANHIFPFANNKYIRKDAVVAWHGSNLYNGSREGHGKGRIYYLSEIAKNSEKYKEYDYKKLELLNVELYCHEAHGKSSEKCRDIEKYNEELNEMEYYDFVKILFNLYKDNGIDERIMDYGLIGNNGELKDFNLVKDNNWDLSKIRFWTFSIEDMKNAGIDKVEYEEGNENYPNKNTWWFKNKVERDVLEYKG